MISIGSRRATRIVPVVLCLLLAVVAGRQLATPARHAVAHSNGAASLSEADHGFLAIASRTPVPVSEARLDLSADAPLRIAALLALVWTAALLVGHGRLEMDTLGVRCRRRGPPLLTV